jgi:pimeloyl-ACP methyl ester carboxylesterase
LNRLASFAFLTAALLAFSVNAAASESREVEFINGNVRLQGTLILPDGSGPHPAVIVVHGSGTNDRENWADQTRFFPEHGVALLKFDKRGGGKSTGDWTQATMQDLARDALAGAAFLRKQKDIDPKRIGLWGGSQGWAVAGLAASLSKELAFVVMVSGYAGPLWDQDTYAQSLQMQLKSMPGPDILLYKKSRDRLKKVIKTGKGFDTFKTDIKKPSFSRILPYLFKGGMVPPKNHPIIRFWQLNVDFNPLDHLPRITCPVLSIWGEKDNGMDANQASEITRTLFAKSRHPDTSVHVFPNADHGLYLRKQPGPGWAKREGRKLVSGYRKLVTDWVLQRVNGGCGSHSKPGY